MLPLPKRVYEKAFQSVYRHKEWTGTEVLFAALLNHVKSAGALHRQTQTAATSAAGTTTTGSGEDSVGGGDSGNSADNDQLGKECISPDILFYVISAQIHLGQHSRGLKLLEVVMLRMGIIPSPDTFRILCIRLAKNGDVEGAERCFAMGVTASEYQLASVSQDGKGVLGIYDRKGGYVDD